MTAHRDNIFIKPEAKAIFKAIDKAKIKPTDGLPIIIEKAEDILKNLKGEQPFKAAKQFEWLIEKLTTYQKNGMGKAIDGALREGQKLNHIVEKMIEEAAKSGNEDEIKNVKTAMEVLSVMQYGLFTSRTMGALKETMKDTSIFSDSKLSWNNNEGIKFVTGALDSTIKFGVKAAGYGATAAINAFRRYKGRNFENSGSLHDKSVEWQKQNKLDRQFETIKNISDRGEIANLKRDRDATGIVDITTAESQLTLLKNKEDICKQNFDRQKGVLAIESDYQKHETLWKEFDDFSKMHERIEKGLATPEEIQKWEKSEDRFEQIQQELDDIESKYARFGTNLDQEYKKINTIDASGKTPLANANEIKNDLERITNERVQKEEQITKYKDADNKINNLNDAIQKRHEAISNWDKNHKDYYQELMAYWDFLQSGGKTKAPLFKCSTQKLQKDMNKKVQVNGQDMTAMEAQYLIWKQQHGYAA